MTRSRGAKFKTEDLYHRDGMRIPVVVFRAIKDGCEKRGVSFHKAKDEMAMLWLEKYLPEDDYKALADFVDTYYPPFKSKETIDFWEEHLGLK